MTYKPIQIYREEVTQAVEVEQIVVWHSGYKHPPPIEDLLARNLVLAPVQWSGMVDQYDGLAAEKSPNAKGHLHRAKKSMREQMNESLSDEERSTQVTELVRRVSGVTMSAGSLAWVLCGGSLVASTLSSIPSWQRFDPRPVLSKKSKSRWEFKDQHTSENTIDKGEAVAGQILDSINDNHQNAVSQHSREGHL
jgi:hypothetical protein